MPLTPEQAATLRAELAKPEYQGLSDADAAARLNVAPATPGQGARKRVPIGDLLRLVHKLALMHPLRVKRAGFESKAAVARIARDAALASGDAAAAESSEATAAGFDALVALVDVAYDYFANPHIEDVDVDDPAFRAMLAGIKQIGVIDNTTEAAILALGDVPGVTTYGATPFQALFGGTRFSATTGEGKFEVTTAVSGTCLPEMVAEARG